jgi:5-methylcytosine-specific restriction endonuclease McrA
MKPRFSLWAPGGDQRVNFSFTLEPFFQMIFTRCVSPADAQHSCVLCDGWCMAWRGPSTPRDPLLDTPLYRRNRAILKAMHLPCAVCGRTDMYSKPGQFVAGHIVSRRKAKLLGWPEAQTNSLANLRPECRSCSNRSGAREGQQAQRAKVKRRQGKVVYGLADDSHRW